MSNHATFWFFVATAAIRMMWSSNLRTSGSAISSVRQDQIATSQTTMLGVLRITVSCCGFCYPKWRAEGPIGAPECHRSDEFLQNCKLRVKPSVDIWSFGGVCNEAAVWVVLGSSGLNEYRRQRQREIDARNTMQDGSCFHDSESIIQAVQVMHDRLLKESEARPTDYITKPVLSHLVTAMLVEEPDERQDAIWLWKRSRKLLEDARSKLDESELQESQRQVEPMFDNAKRSDHSATVAPSQVSQEATESGPRQSHSYGPPPHIIQYSSNIETSAVPNCQPPRNDDTSETILGSFPEHSNAERINIDNDASHRKTNIMTSEQDLLLPSRSLAFRTEPKKPYLSFQLANQTQERRDTLPSSHQNLLNDLIGRDHVRPDLIPFPSPSTYTVPDFLDRRFNLHAGALE